MEDFTCRFCYEEFSNRDDVISPCACSGSSKYVCKECLNKYMVIDRTDKKYTECPTCKQKYNRNVPKIHDSVNCDVRDEVCYGVGVLTLLTVMFLFLGKFQAIFIFCLLALYFMTACKILKNHANNVWLFAFLVFFYALLLFTPHKWSYIGYALWVILIYGYFGVRLISNGWDTLFESKYNSAVGKLSCWMFDFDLHRYVPGIL